MAINYVDYEVLENGKRVYAQRAEELENLLNALITMNGELSEGWQNDTARAFVERFSNDHKPAIQKVIAALNDISSYINTYAANRSMEDQQGAAAVRG